MKHSWYHCGHCGALFESAFGTDEKRVCPDCSRIPGTGVWPVREGRPKKEENDVSSFDKVGEVLEEGGQRAVRKKRKKNMMMRVVVVWAVIMVLAVWFRAHSARIERERENRKKREANLAEGTMADERVALLTEALPVCHKALAGFLTGGSPENRNQFVADPIETAGKMAAFYRDNPFPKVDAGALRRVGQEPVRVGDEWVIETRWKGKDGVEFDAVFRRDAGTWRLDWEHFNRYSEAPWALFLAGEGPDEAEFRLLARKVQGGNQAEQGGSRLRFVLLSPEFGKPSGTGMVSPEFVVDRRSDEGLLLGAAFDSRESGKVPFGGSMNPMEPEGFVRVRILVKRGEFGGVRSFSIQKLLACHWISGDAVGFDLDRLKDDLFGAK